MDKFLDLIYNRPNYEFQKEKLLQSKKMMLQSQTYEELRNTWIEMKDSMYRLDFIETIAYIRYLCGIDTAIYRPEVMIQSEEDPKLTVLQNECNQVLLDSAFLSEFQEEFGTQIVEIMRSHMMLSSSETNILQAEESQLMNKYIHLIALQGRTQKMNDQYYTILDHLIKIRTQIAGHLGYSSYIDMALWPIEKISVSTMAKMILCYFVIRLTNYLLRYVMKSIIQMKFMM